MIDFLLQNASSVRLASFVGILTTMVFWESLAPKRKPVEARLRHGTRNVALTVFNGLVVRLCIPLLPVAFAAQVTAWNWGLLSLLEWNANLEIVIAVIILDFAIYLQHRVFHAVPVLWRLHKVHHTDLDFDSTMGIRFHPIEIMLSLGIKFLVIMALGPPAISVLLFEIILNGSALFNHGNVNLPLTIDKPLRWLLVTPDMHRVHHSVIVQETNSNYGFALPWWDRIFRTYTDQPSAGHDQMEVGLSEYRDLSKLSLLKLLFIPFGKKPAK